MHHEIPHQNNSKQTCTEVTNGLKSLDHPHKKDNGSNLLLKRNDLVHNLFCIANHKNVWIFRGDESHTFDVKEHIPL
jgi:hypothetical protein